MGLGTWHARGRKNRPRQMHGGGYTGGGPLGHIFIVLFQWVLWQAGLAFRWGKDIKRLYAQKAVQGPFGGGSIKNAGQSCRLHEISEKYIKHQVHCSSIVSRGWVICQGGKGDSFPKRKNNPEIFLRGGGAAILTNRAGGAMIAVI